MMDKYCDLSGRDDTGRPLVHMFEPGSKYGLQESGELQKVASGEHLPQVMELVESIQPQPGRLYLINSALGAGEWVGFNLRGDWFTEKGLMHEPYGWKDIPVWDIDARRRCAAQTEPAGKWGDLAWGYPTFMNAHRYQHHCFVADTKITMADRTRALIQDVHVGDVVATRAGNKKVTSTFVRAYTGPGVRIELRGVPDDLISTVDHPVCVLRRRQVHCRHKYNRLHPENPYRFQHPAGFHVCEELRAPVGEPEWTDACDVEVGDYMLVPVPAHGTKSVATEFAELVGWVASEGYLGPNGEFAFTFAADNLDDIGSVENCFEEFGLAVRFSGHLIAHNLMCFSAYHRPLHDAVAQFVTGKYNEKRLLAGVMEWDRESLLHMLGAYIDGDGHVCDRGQNEGQLRIRSCSPQMLAILADVVRSLGVDCTVNMDSQPGPLLSPTNGLYYWGRGSGCVAVAKDWAPLLTKYSRKHHVREVPEGRQSRNRQTLPYRGCILKQITAVDIVELKENVYNLEVEDVHEYIANEVVVHNCNTDTNKARGYVLGVFYDHRMHRVVIVSELIESLCAQHGGLDVYARIARGEFPDTSIGIKVPYDRCSICNHVARTPKDYDEHVGAHALPPYGMRALLPDGRRCGIYNDYPRGFDDSFVFIGAERSAKVMSNVTQQVRGNRPYTDRWYLPGQHTAGKTAVAGAAAMTPIEQELQLAKALDEVERSHIAGPIEKTVASSISKVLSSLPTVDKKEERALEHAAQVERRRAALQDRTMSNEEFRFWSDHQKGELRGHGIERDHTDRALANLREKMNALGTTPKYGSLAKWATLTKEIPVPTSAQAALVRDHTSRLSAVRPAVLDVVRAPDDLWQLLSQLAHLGVVLRPREFQDSMLGAMGEPQDEDDFCPTPLDPYQDSPWCPSAPEPTMLRKLVDLLGPSLPGRSFAPRLVVVRIMSAPPVQNSPSRNQRSAPALNRISQMYNDYRNGLITHAPDYGYVPTPPLSAQSAKLADAASTVSSLLLHLAFR